MKRCRAVGIRFAVAAVTLRSGVFKEDHQRPRRHELLRLFSLTFPDGRAGLGLLLLRAAVGLTVVIQGGVYLADRSNLTLWTWMVGIMAVASGASLLIGFLTPIDCILVWLGSVAIACSWFSANAPDLLDNGLPLLIVMIMAAAVVLLGPGAYSLDARLFGRREIIIPHASRRPKS